MRKRLCIPLLLSGLAMSPPGFAVNITPELKVNGFATAGIAKLDQNSGGWGTSPTGAAQYYRGASYMQNSYGRAGINEDLNTKFDSVVGLQFDYQVNDQTNMVVQLVAKGQNQDSFKPQADWAYIRYAFDENWIARAGRLGFPGFMISDSMLVGHSYTWVRPPAEVYANTPVPSVQGADLTWRHGLGDWMFDAQFFGGMADTSDNRLAVGNIASLYLSLSHENLTIRGGALRFNLANNVSLAPLPDLDDSRSGRFGSFGFIYDDAWYLSGEYVQQRVVDWPADFNAGYFTVGHHFGRFLPYVYWAKVVTVGDDKKQVGAYNTRPSSIFEQATYAAGVRFDPKPGLSLKAQVEHITDMGQYNGMFRFGCALASPATACASTAPGSGVAAIAGAQKLPALKPANLFSLTANVAF